VAGKRLCFLKVEVHEVPAKRVRGELRLLVSEDRTGQSVSKELANQLIGVTEVEHDSSSRIEAGDNLSNKVRCCRVVVSTVPIEDRGPGTGRSLGNKKSKQRKVVRLESVLHDLLAGVVADISDYRLELRYTLVQRPRL
jgi:hypothetical protein